MEEQIDHAFVMKEAVSLYQAFENVRDMRGRKGRRYPLPLILILLLLGKMAGETTIDGIVDWLNERAYEIQRLLNWPKRFPTNKTYVYALSKCDHHEIVKVISHVIERARAKKNEERKRNQERKEDQLMHVALDGKILRGTIKHARDDQPVVHLLSFYECESGRILDQFLVPKERNEESACKEILHPLLVKDRIISVDSIFSSRGWCAAIHAFDGYYMNPIKNNNPAVRQDIEDFFHDPGENPKEIEYHKTTNKGHGRLEVREIWVTTQMNEWFQRDWAGIAQVFKIRRYRKNRWKEEEEIVYGITNLERAKAGAQRLLELNREHWSIENCLHRRRDVTLGEDANQTSKKGVPEVLAALNGGLLAIMDFLDIKNIAKYMRHCCAVPKDALQPLIYTL